MTLVGASLMAQLHESVLCALIGAGVDLRAADEQWTFSRMDVFTADNLQGAVSASHPCDRSHIYSQPKRGRAAVRYIRRHRCTALGHRFEELLNTTDVLILGLNPSHYKGDGLWEHDVRHALRAMDRWAAASPRRVAVWREPALNHFRNGEYDPTVAHSRAATAEGCCRPLAPAVAHRTKHASLARAAEALASAHAPRVRVLRWLNETLPRHDAHKSDACRFDSPKVDGLHPNPGRLTGHRNSTGRPVRSCCDCVHFCYSKLFYDAVFFTPLHQILSEALK